jgi:molybdopterin molybdotransferase
MMGHRRVLNPFLPALLGADVRKSSGNAKLLRVKLEERDSVLWAWSAGRQDTGLQSTLLRGDGLAFLPANRVAFSAGEQVTVQILNRSYPTLMDAVGYAVQKLEANMKEGVAVE